jgi:hypothetical protein
LGWTLPVSFFGGMAPPGPGGMFSAITVTRLSWTKLKVWGKRCQILKSAGSPKLGQGKDGMAEWRSDGVVEWWRGWCKSSEGCGRVGVSRSG